MPLRFWEKIADAIANYEEVRRVVVPGHVNVSMDLMGVLLDEMREHRRYVLPMKEEIGLHNMKIRGWPVYPVGDMKPLEWSIVPP